MAHKGHEVTVVERHSVPGGRARVFSAEGFQFDMGPSWYWMPDVFDEYFARYGKKTSDYYDLIRLDPSYRVFWPDDQWDIPAGMRELEHLFESTEQGSAERLREFLRDAAVKYGISMGELIYKPGKSVLEFVDFRLLRQAMRLSLFSSVSAHIRNYFSHPKLIELLEFPVLFLGALPEETPALYSIMNHADLTLGTWYPMGGMGKITEAMHQLAEELGVSFEFNVNVEEITLVDGKATGIIANGKTIAADAVIAAGDYHHMEELLPQSVRNYTPGYWEKRVMAPSCLIFYIGTSQKITGLKHHNLFFDESFRQHGNEIYRQPSWPTKPLFYTCVPSITDPSVAPEGCENLFVLIPLAPGLPGDDEAIRENYFNQVMDRLEKRSGSSIRKHIVFKRSYCTSDFSRDYNAFKGNAYGLANTLGQTAIFKPRIDNKRTKGLFYAGQLTVPGPGVPPALISGNIAANQVIRHKTKSPL